MSKTMAEGMRLQFPLRVRDLSTQQQALVQIMGEHRFGWIENLPVRGGQPVFTPDVKIVRVAKLGAETVGQEPLHANEFELKGPLRELFDEFVRLQNGIVVRLEFRHGLPFILQTVVNSV